MAGIYIHIPFCKKICSYCDFFRIISKGNNSSFVDTLLQEAKMRSGYLGDEPVKTIYIGGGTPSVLIVPEIKTILDGIYSVFSVVNDCEITIELNPDDIDIQYLKGLKELNINRISLGIQSWRDEDLKLLNRRHSSEQAKNALMNVFNAGFENVSVDLIYGIPGMSLAAWGENLDKTFNFNIKHLSAYHLTVEPGTTLGKMKEKGLFEEVEEEESANQFNILIEKSEKAGFIQYEISNFGQAGFFSQHNTNYWKQINYLGLGPSAHSFNNYSRQWNIRNVNSYINSVKHNKPFYEGEELSTRTRFNEYIMTSLRTMWGIDLDFVETNFEKEGYDYIMNMAGKFKNYGLMKQENRNLILSNQGKMISDNIIAEFMMPENE